MHGNEDVINSCADDGNLDSGCRSAEYFEARRQTVDICARILFLLVLTTYDSISTWYNIDDKKWLDNLREI